jgi:hypothetical protein
MMSCSQENSSGERRAGGSALADKAHTLTLSAPPTGSVVRTNVDHLRLALRTVVGKYVARGRR